MMVLLCGISMVLTACGPEFDPYWRANKLRLLSMRSDPATLLPGQTATFEALVSNPAGDELTYAWEWCPFTVSPQQEFECPITREELIEILEQALAEGSMDGMMMMGPDGEMVPMDELPPGFDIGLLVPEFKLGEEPTARLPYPLTPDFVLGLCQGLQVFLGTSDLTNEAGITSSCEEGWDVTMRVVVSGGGDTEIGAKRFTLWTGSEFDKNQNPDITGIDIRLANEDDLSKLEAKLPWLAQSSEDPERWVRIPDDAPVPILANIPFDLRSVVDPMSLELYQRPAPTGSEIERLPAEREGLEFRWFVEAGDLDDSRQLFGEESGPLDEVPVTSLTINYNPSPSREQLKALEKEQEDDWDLDGRTNDSDNCPYVNNPDQADSDADGIGDRCTMSVWSVVNDGRLGVDWIERRLVIIDTEPF